MKILAIVGSLRKGSINRQLAEKVGEIIGDRAELEILDYHDIPYMNEDLEDNPPEAITRVRNKVIEADGVWIFTPEYNHSYPGVLKNLIDWLSRPMPGKGGNVISGKKVAISGASPSMVGTAIAQDMLVMMLSFLNVKIMNQPRVFISDVFNQMDGDKLALKESVEFVEKQVDSFIDFIKNN